MILVMSDHGFGRDVDVFSKIIRAGRRTYFFDVKQTSSKDCYLTITESKKFTNEDETVYYKRHKIFVFREDFEEFKSVMEECMTFVSAQKQPELPADNKQDNTQEEGENKKNDFED